MALSRSQRFRRASKKENIGAAELGRRRQNSGLIEHNAKSRMSKMRAHFLAVIMTISLGNLASAHPQLQSAEPGAGVATASPKEIRITFSEPVIPRFSGVELKDQSGKPITTGKSETDPANRKVLVVPIKEQLAPGAYNVEWHAVSDDTHRVNGSYSFSVAP
jgi:methionine-rich copper-binding protein CopC